MKIEEHIKIINEQAEAIHREHGFVADRHNAYMQLKIAIADIERSHKAEIGNDFNVEGQQ